MKEREREKETITRNVNKRREGMLSTKIVVKKFDVKAMS